VTDSDEPSPWRSLSQYEVLAADFNSTGEDWDAVFPPEFAEPVPDWLRAELPDTGWREVTVRDPRGLAANRQLFAAPTDVGWATALIGPQAEGLPLFMGDMGRYRLRPDQATRRQGLQLSWEEPLRVASSDLNDVNVALTNTTDAVWMPDPEDHAFVHGHFLDEQGQSPVNCSFAYGSHQGQWKGVVLAPGESMQLPVTFSHDGPPERGSYGIEAVLVSLNLRSPKGTLEIVSEPDTDLQSTGGELTDPLRQRLAILRAQQKAIDDPQAVIAIASQSDSDGDFVLSLMAAFDIDFAQAVAIGNMQIRRFFKVEHDQLRTEISGLRKQLKGDSRPNP
jgi:hypothetical protein